MLDNLRIETERLVIKSFIKEDLMECFELMQNKELFTYMDMSVMTLDEYKGLFNWLISSYKVDPDDDFKYSFNITLKDSGKHVGWITVGGFPFDHEEKEIGYLIGRDYWGNGYATESAKAMLEYVFNEWNLEKISAIVKPDNIASRKVIEKMGLKYKHIIEGLKEDFDFYNGELYFSLTREEYIKLL